MSSLGRISFGYLKKSGVRSLYQFKDNPKLKKLKEKQAEFQRFDKLPVFLKGGKKDRILYNITIGLGVLGALCTAQFFWDHAWEL